MESIPNEILDSQISDIDIDEISNKYLTKWKRLLSVLGLTRVHEESICTGNVDGQRRELLYTWKELKGDSATYRSLIDAAEKVQNKNLADNIRRLLSKRLHKPGTHVHIYIHTCLMSRANWDFYLSVSSYLHTLSCLECGYIFLT